MNCYRFTWVWILHSLIHLSTTCKFYLSDITYFWVITFVVAKMDVSVILEFKFTLVCLTTIECVEFLIFFINWACCIQFFTSARSISYLFENKMLNIYITYCTQINATGTVDEIFEKVRQLFGSLRLYLVLSLFI